MVQLLGSHLSIPAEPPDTIRACGTLAGWEYGDA